MSWLIARVTVLIAGLVAFVVLALNHNNWAAGMLFIPGLMAGSLCVPPR